MKWKHSELDNMRGGKFPGRRESRNVWVSEENQNSIEKSSDEKACVSK